MFKFIVWAVGTGLILWAVEHWHLWASVITTTFLACAILWVIGGAIALGGSIKPQPKALRGAPTPEDVQRAVSVLAALKQRGTEVGK